MNTWGRCARHRPGVLTLAVLVVAAIACNAGAAGSSGGQTVNGEIPSASPAAADNSAGGSSAGQTVTGGGAAESDQAAAAGSGVSSGGDDGIVHLDGGQDVPSVAAELDFGGAGAGGCTDPCGICAGEGNTYDPITEPTLISIYKISPGDLALPDAHTKVCACGFPDDNIDAHFDPSIPEILLGQEVTYRDEVQSYCAVEDVSFAPGAVAGDYDLTIDHPAGSVAAQIDVGPAEHPDAHWFDDKEVWFAGFVPNEPVDIYFWQADDMVNDVAEVRYIGMTSATANELGDVYVDSVVGGVTARVVGVTAASGEVVACRNGFFDQCLTVSGVPLENIIFLRTNQ
jgi:hypothetical protein